MRLSELRDQVRSGQKSESGEVIGTIRNLATFPKHREAVLNGQVIHVIATGDITGMSPAVQYIDEHGHSDWVSLEDVRFIGASVPLGDEQRRQLLKGSSERQTTGSTRR